jgi:hypothetical protein
MLFFRADFESPLHLRYLMFQSVGKLKTASKQIIFISKFRHRPSERERDSITVLYFIFRSLIFNQYFLYGCKFSSCLFCRFLELFKLNFFSVKTLSDSVDFTEGRYCCHV